VTSMSVDEAVEIVRKALFLSPDSVNALSGSRPLSDAERAAIVRAASERNGPLITTVEPDPFQEYGCA
jgi:hypothetical protein